MLKQELIDRLNDFRSKVAENSQPIFTNGSEEEIMLLVEQYRVAYAYVREESQKVAKKRRLKKLKAQGSAAIKAEKGLLERLPSPKKGKPKPKTKEDRFNELASKLGVDLGKLQSELANGSKK